jgi:predicted  nucleic acid-binding Zn-ribbon protein
MSDYDDVVGAIGSLPELSDQELDQLMDELTGDGVPADAAHQGDDKGGAGATSTLPPPSVARPEQLAEALEDASAEVERLQEQVYALRSRPLQSPLQLRQAEKRLREGNDRVHEIQTRQGENVYAEATGMLVARQQAKRTAEAECEVDRDIKDLRKKAERVQSGAEANLVAWDRAMLAEQKRSQSVQTKVAEKLAEHSARLKNCTGVMPRSELCGRSLLYSARHSP